jgi:hypothetical protein
MLGRGWGRLRHETLRLESAVVVEQACTEATMSRRRQQAGTDSFAPGIPACSMGGQLCIVPCGVVGDPPGVQLLVPTRGIAGAADTDRRAPDGGVSTGVHRDLLDGVRAAIFSQVRFDQPTA